MSGALRAVRSVDDLGRLAPLDRFWALIDGPNFAAYLRDEPVVFDVADPIYGYGCGVEGCAQPGQRVGGVVHSTRTPAAGGVGCRGGRGGVESRRRCRCRLRPGGWG